MTQKSNQRYDDIWEPILTTGKRVSAVKMNKKLFSKFRCTNFGDRRGEIIKVITVKTELADHSSKMQNILLYSDILALSKSYIS